MPAAPEAIDEVSREAAVPPSTLEIGRVVKPHGLRGEVIVQLFTNRLERLDPGTNLACSCPPAAAPGRVDGGDRAGGARGVPRELEVVESRPHQGRHLVRFAGIASIEQAEALRGVVLEAEPIEDPEAMFVHDLIGCEIVDVGGARRGTVTAVEANPASDLLVVDDRHYVPLRFVVHRKPGELVVEVPDGLFD